MTYTFKLHPNVKFHDGTTLTSNDVKATYDRMRNPPKGVVSPRQATFADIGTIETPDANTIVFKMKAVNASMIEHFASPWNCIYSAKDLAADPNSPRTKINGTGPYVFVEHVKGSHVTGRRNDNYFKKGLPYLDGFRGVFTLQAAAMLNAVQGGQLLGEFRGISPAERDRLVAAMGDKIRIEEESWTLNLLVAFNTEKKPFDDVRVRRALLMSIDRWGGSAGLSKISLLRSVGGVIRPGSPMATPPEELAKLPGYSKNMAAARAEARKLLKEAGVPNLKFVAAQPHRRAALHAGRHLPGRPVAADRRDGGAQAVRDLALSRGAERRQLRGRDRLLQPVHGRLDARARQVPVVRPLAAEPLARDRSRARQALRRARARDATSSKRKALIQAFERRVFEQAYQQPILWWHRIVPTHKTLMGWEMSPSHNLGAQLEDVWLNQ